MNWLPIECYNKNRCLIMQATTRFRLPGTTGGYLGKVKLKQVIQELLTAKKIANRRNYYLQSLEGYLNRFAAKHEHQQINEITEWEIEQWLTQFPNPSSRQTWLNRLSTLFAFAVRRGYIRENPCARIERISIERKPPSILTVDQARQLLDWCPQLFRPYLVLAMFAGIRPQEVERLNWSDANLDTKTVKINVPKVQSHRRIVPLESVAVELLTAHPIKAGPICPSKGALRGWKRRARKFLGYDKWPKDILRHTAASYLLALHDNVDKIAKDLGNSPKILLNHYHEPVTKEAAALFWAIR